MNAEQPPTQNAWQFAVGFILMLCFSLLLVLVFLNIVDLPAFVFLPMLMLGGIVGLVHARRRHSTWQRAVRINWFQRQSGQYIGASSLGFLAIIVSAILLPTYLQKVLLGAVFGAVIGYLVGYFFWLISLYPRKNKSVND